MTISKERFEQLALEVWNNGATEYDDREGDFIVTDFAHALIKRVEAESDPIIKHYNGDGSVSNYVELPLVGE